MKTLGQLLSGIAWAVGSSILVLSAIMLSLTEGMSVAMLVPTASVTPPTAALTAAPPLNPLTPAAATNTPLVITLAPTPTLSKLCPPPENWVLYTVEPGDDLQSLAERTGTTVEEIERGNCMNGMSDPGQLLYLPKPLPTATATPAPLPTRAPCNLPRGWIRYTVQPNDNLFRLSQAFGISLGEMMSANCRSDTLIVAGSTLYVPNVPTRTPVYTATDTPEPPTITPEPPTHTPTHTSLPPTDTVAAPTETPTHTPETPTETPSPTVTDTVTPTPTETIAPPTVEPSLTPTSS